MYTYMPAAGFWGWYYPQRALWEAVIDLNMAIFANSKTVVRALFKNGAFLVGWRTLRSAASARKFDTKLTRHFFPNEDTRISEHVLRCGNWPVFSIFTIFQCAQFFKGVSETRNRFFRRV